MDLPVKQPRSTAVVRVGMVLGAGRGSDPSTRRDSDPCSSAHWHQCETGSEPGRRRRSVAATQATGAPGEPGCSAAVQEVLSHLPEPLARMQQSKSCGRCGGSQFRKRATPASDSESALAVSRIRTGSDSDAHLQPVGSLLADAQIRTGSDSDVHWQ